MKLDDLAIIEVEKKKMDSKRLRKGDIIVEKSGGGPKQPVGRAILFDIDDTDFSFCNFTSALRIKDSSKILPEYLHKYLTYLYFSGATEKYQSNLVGFRNLDFKGYVSMEIKYPSLKEQQRIVNVLDNEFEKIDRLKVNAEQTLQYAKDLFQAALKNELEPKEGWEKVHLKDIYDVRDGTHDSPKYYSVGYPLATSKNLRNGSIDLTDAKLISKVDYDKINERSKVDIGDVLFAMIGTIGNPCYVEDAPYYAIKNMALFKVPNNQSGRFLKYVLLSDGVLNEMHNKAKGSNQPFVSLGYLRNFEIFVPSLLAEQQRIVAILDEFDAKCKKLQNNYTKTISLCDDLKQALLRKAFNGEL